MKKGFAKTLPSKLKCCLQNEGLFAAKNGSQESNVWVLEQIREQALIVLPCAKYHRGLVVKERILLPGDRGLCTNPFLGHLSTS